MSIPAMLAVIKQMIEPDTKARTATDVMLARRSGAIADKEAIIMPNELGLANPHTA